MATSRVIRASRASLIATSAVPSTSIARTLRAGPSRGNSGTDASVAGGSPSRDKPGATAVRNSPRSSSRSSLAIRGASRPETSALSTTCSARVVSRTVVVHDA
jgi:hypothetical protein